MEHTPSIETRLEELVFDESRRLIEDQAANLDHENNRLTRWQRQYFEEQVAVREREFLSHATDARRIETQAALIRAEQVLEDFDRFHVAFQLNLMDGRPAEIAAQRARESVEAHLDASQTTEHLDDIHSFHVG